MTAPQTARSGAPAARVSETPGDTAQPGVSQTTGRGSGSPRPVPDAGASGPRERTPGPAGLISPPRYASRACVCGHLDVFHDLKLRKAGRVRTACSWTTGPQVDNCPCELYQEAA